MISFNDTEILILDTIAELVTPGRWTSLTTIRPHLTRWTRTEQDAALRKIERLDDVNIVPESNQKTLTWQDWDAAVVIGDQEKHLIWMAG